MAGTLKARYERLTTLRRPFLERARAAARLTIPSLLPPEGHTSSNDFETPWQSMGARGVRNLNSKMLLALFPPNTPFFKLELDEFELENLQAETGQPDDEELKSKLQAGLSRIEQATIADAEASSSRVVLEEVLKHLLVAGNVCVFTPDEGPLRLFTMDQFVVKRSPDTKLLQLIIREEVHPAALPPEVREACKCTEEESEDKPISVFTEVSRGDEKWFVRQEINDESVPGTEGSYPLNNSPWLVPRGIAVAGEDYGRSYVEELYGDLRTLEDLTQAVVEGAQGAAKLLWMVAPNSTTRAGDLEKDNGSVIVGDPNDVAALQADKFADFRTAQTVLDTIQQRLAFAFLLNAATQRDAERVTAQEIRFVARELEDALGGIYSTLSQELQRPLAQRLMRRLQSRGRLPQLGKQFEDLTKLAITTGIEALGRNHEVGRLQEFMTTAGQTLSPDVLAQFLGIREYLRRLSTGLGIDESGLVKDSQEAAQDQQQQQILDILAQAGPGVIQELVKQGGQLVQQQQTSAQQ